MMNYKNKTQLNRAALKCDKETRKSDYVSVGSCLGKLSNVPQVSVLRISSVYLLLRLVFCILHLF
jgi:hypothetical protein